MQSEAKAKALEQFTDYFVRNYPGPDTIIYDPKWHAPKIFAAAYSAISAALSDKQAGEVKEPGVGPSPSPHLRGTDVASALVDQIEKDILTNPAVAIATTSYRWHEMRSSWGASIFRALSDKPVICVGTHTIDKLKSGEHVETGAAIMIPASDLSDPEPGEHQEVLDAIAAHNSGEEE